MFKKEDGSDIRPAGYKSTADSLAEERARVAEIARKQDEFKQQGIDYVKGLGLDKIADGEILKIKSIGVDATLDAKAAELKKLKAQVDGMKEFWDHQEKIIKDLSQEEEKTKELIAEISPDVKQLESDVKKMVELGEKKIKEIKDLESSKTLGPNRDAIIKRYKDRLAEHELGVDKLKASFVDKKRELEVLEEALPKLALEIQGRRIILARQIGPEKRSAEIAYKKAGGVIAGSKAAAPTGGAAVVKAKTIDPHKQELLDYIKMPENKQFRFLENYPIVARAKLEDFILEADDWKKSQSEQEDKIRKELGFALDGADTTKFGPDARGKIKEILGVDLIAILEGAKAENAAEIKRVAAEKAKQEEKERLAKEASAPPKSELEIKSKEIDAITSVSIEEYKRTRIHEAELQSAVALRDKEIERANRARADAELLRKKAEDELVRFKSQAVGSQAATLSPAQKTAVRKARNE